MSDLHLERAEGAHQVPERKARERAVARCTTLRGRRSVEGASLVPRIAGAPVTRPIGLILFVLLPAAHT